MLQFQGLGNFGIHIVPPSLVCRAETLFFVRSSLRFRIMALGRILCSLVPNQLATRTGAVYKTFVTSLEMINRHALGRTYYFRVLGISAPCCYVFAVRVSQQAPSG